MPGTTPLYGLTYPIGTDRLDDAVTTIPQQLAEDVESTIAGFGGIAAPGSWVAMPYASNWADVGFGWTQSRYRKTGQVVRVEFYGTRSSSGSGAGAVIATLPSGFRPLAFELIPGIITNSGATVITVTQIHINSAGQIVTAVDCPSGSSIVAAGDVHID